ncbi:MAG: metallophosphatase [Bacteroidaceae bacterium]|nr:metallophosphatase [Bacteroidaceae bacterium]
MVHTNDTHSCIEKINPNLSDTTLAGKGGFLRRTAAIENFRKEDPELLLFDSGDFSQGSAYYNLFKGEVEIKLMNMMKYDAGTIGNHEFDFGLDNMARIFEMANFPILCCNYDFSNTPVEKFVKPYTIINRKGVKIGVTAVCTVLDGLVSKANSGDTKFLDPIENANKIADFLKNEEKCDIVVCLSHLGWGVETINDEQFIKGTKNIDIVLGGHSHTYFSEPKYIKNSIGKDVLCNQMGKSGRFVGTLKVEMDKINK